MIKFENVTFKYSGANFPILENVNLTIPTGELALVVGKTGSGKSTLLGLINGLVPSFTGGDFSGNVSVNGRSIKEFPPRDFADLVGVVRQDPRASFVTDLVEDELAYGMEQLGVSPSTMRRRVEEVLDLLGLEDLRNRSLATLSGGQRQRVAIASVLTTNPKVLVLDEPTSALDPSAAEEVLAAIQRLVHDLGLTVVLAEHRLERVVQYADRVIVVDRDAEVYADRPAQVFANSQLAPPVVELGRAAGWSPLPLTVRDARKFADELRIRLEKSKPRTRVNTPVKNLVNVQNLNFNYGNIRALRNIDLNISDGEIVALMGRNGSGKSTLLSQLVGLLEPTVGSVLIDGKNPNALQGKLLIESVGLVPQEPTDLLISDSVSKECISSDSDSGAIPGTTLNIFEQLTTDVSEDSHPRDLSEGEKLSLALAVVLAAKPPLILLDEPTRGLDYAAKRQLVSNLQKLGKKNHTVILATHDVELAAEVATRVILLADGEIVTDGPVNEVLSSSPMFSPQVSKVMSPAQWLTVSDIAYALEELK
jgi:energy-coupling factor transport system ATP-binding protein